MRLILIGHNLWAVDATRQPRDAFCSQLPSLSQTPGKLYGRFPSKSYNQSMYFVSGKAELLANAHQAFRKYGHSLGPEALEYLEDIVDRHEIPDDEVEGSIEFFAKEYNKQDGA